MEDYARRRQDVQSAKIALMQKELENLRLQHEVFKDQLTPRNGPATDRSFQTDRRPEIYHGRLGAHHTPINLATPREDSGERRPESDNGSGGGGDKATFQGISNERRPEIYYGYGERDRMAVGGLATNRSLPLNRRPGIYRLDIGRNDNRSNQPAQAEEPTERRPGENKDEKRKQDWSTLKEESLGRRPEMYHGYANRDVDTNDYSPRREDKKYDYEEIRRNEQKKIYSYYDTTTINPPKDRELRDRGHKHHPWYDHGNLPDPGGLGIMRFRDSAYDLVKIGLQQLDSIRRNTGGYLVGCARKQKICVYECAPSRQLCWIPSRKQESKDYMAIDDAIAVFWFTSGDAFQHYFECSHNNRFKEPGFPDQNGYESFYLPLMVAPTARPMNTFLFIEFPCARQYELENFTQFEAELRQEMLRSIPGCLPMAVSLITTGNRYYKPGTMISPNSKVYVCRFESQRDVDKIMKSGMIQSVREKCNLRGQINVASFTTTEMR